MSKNKKEACRHDYKNAIPFGNIDHFCPLCKKVLDPLEWFFMNSFEFVDVSEALVEKKKKRKRLKSK